MKKNLIALLVVLALVTVGLFANDPDPVNLSADFTVTTSIKGINDIKVTTTPTTVSNFGGATSFTTLTIGSGSGESEINTGTGVVTFAAYLSTRSNNRNGYTVSVSATPMESNGSFINYSVTVAGDGTQNGDPGGSYDTADENAAETPVITVGSLGALDVQSRAISLTVDSGEYAAAVEGTYSGTVTFNYLSN